MKITITKEVEVKIEFPAYYTWGQSFYKIESETEYTEVRANEHEFSVEVRKSLTTGFVESIITKGEPSRGIEFYRAFDQVFNKLEMEYAKIDPTHRFNQQPEEENGLEESERNEDRINEYYELESHNQE